MLNCHLRCRVIYTRSLKSADLVMDPITRQSNWSSRKASQTYLYQVRQSSNGAEAGRILTISRY